jgi:RNA polymerase sigma-70 factor (ECF subfamily)
MPTELEFADQYARCENEVQRFISSLVPHRPDAEELMQETARILWVKYFESESPIRSFKAWACQIAFYEVLTYRKTKNRERLIFSQDVVEQLAEVRQNRDEVLTHRRAALGKCLKELEWADIELLQTRYGIAGNEATERVSTDTKQPITNAMSKRLQRVRRLLLHCVERRVLEATS